MWTLWCFVPGLMRMSMPLTSVLEVISMFAVDTRPTDWLLLRML